MSTDTQECDLYALRSDGRIFIERSSGRWVEVPGPHDGNIVDSL